MNHLHRPGQLFTELVSDSLQVREQSVDLRGHLHPVLSQHLDLHPSYHSKHLPKSRSIFLTSTVNHPRNQSFYLSRAFSAISSVCSPAKISDVLALSRNYSHQIRVIYYHLQQFPLFFWLKKILTSHNCYLNRFLQLFFASQRQLQKFLLYFFLF